jgi:xylulose-5-phosphate/fructose-6-phosphate phosphoketolase
MNVPVSPRDLPVAEDSAPKGIDVLESQEWRQLDAYWRAANYLSVGQIYLYANPMMREPLTLAHVKPLVVGHWGTTPGQNFIYVHLNRTIRQHDLDMIYIAGPGHGGPALVANTYLEGSYSEIYPDVSQDEAGMSGCSSSSPFPAAFQATWRRRRPARFTRAANWVIP